MSERLSGVLSWCKAMLHTSQLALWAFLSRHSFLLLCVRCLLYFTKLRDVVR